MIGQVCTTPVGVGVGIDELGDFIEREAEVPALP